MNTSVHAVHVRTHARTHAPINDVGAYIVLLLLLLLMLLAVGLHCM